MAIPSAYESLEYESSRMLKKARKQLRKINEYAPMFREMSEDDLKDYYHEWLESIGEFNMSNKKQVVVLYALAREVTFRLTGKFQYDVQVLGALSALERNMIQMATGSGKTLTLILPVVAFGLMHKGVYVLTVNDYLSKRDWEETKPIYDWFELSNGYVSHDDEDPEQQAVFAKDIIYCTNSTLGFAYLNSELASDIGHDMKLIKRPLFAAIIDEADEILMDDARNPLIIASATDISGDFDDVEFNGKSHSIQGIVDVLKTMSNMGYDDDAGGQPYIDDRAMDEIQERLGVGDEMFDNHKLMHVVYSATNALFQYRAYTDYIVKAEPDEDTGSRIVLIDKATGRLAKGRTLSDNMHAFLEMKEGVFSGQSNDSSIQITYQTLFNLFQTIAGVSGTLGTSYKEFIDIYETGVVLIPDRLPNQLKQVTHLYATNMSLYDDLVMKTRFYISAHHPVLIGAMSDIGVDIISNILTNHGIEHKTLVSTDTNEDVVVADAGKPGSVVVTTDIMGRGTDIHIEDVEGERGLVVFQVGARPNSRVERQFAGRAARQGQPGRYHRMLSMSEMSEIGVGEADVNLLLSEFRKNRHTIEYYQSDLLLNGRNPDYSNIVDIIDNALIGNESQYSSSRVEDFRSYSITDIIQTSLLVTMDKHRLILKASIEDGAHEELRELAADLSVDEEMKPKLRRKLVESNRTLIDTVPIDELQKQMFHYISQIVDKLIPELREYSDDAINTTKLAGQVKHEKKPEDMMIELIKKFLDEKADYFIFDTPKGVGDVDSDA